MWLTFGLIDYWLVPRFRLRMPAALLLDAGLVLSYPAADQGC